MNKRRSRPKLADWHLWTEVKRTVRPLRADDLVPEEPVVEAPLPIPAAKQPPVFDKGAKWLGPSLPAYVPPTSVKRRTGPGQVIEPRIKRRLIRGQIELEGTIDLHGMRQGEAYAALQRFIIASVSRGDRSVLVITGKGLSKSDDRPEIDRGILRTMLPIWLSEATLAPFIAGWDSASQGHGGTGAFYVRLRRVSP